MSAPQPDNSVRIMSEAVIAAKEERIKLLVERRNELKGIVSRNLGTAGHALSQTGAADVIANSEGRKKIKAQGFEDIKVGSDTIRITEGNFIVSDDSLRDALIDGGLSANEIQVDTALVQMPPSTGA